MENEKVSKYNLRIWSIFVTFSNPSKHWSLCLDIRDNTTALIWTTNTGITQTSNWAKLYSTNELRDRVKSATLQIAVEYTLQNLHLYLSWGIHGRVCGMFKVILADQFQFKMGRKTHFHISEMDFQNLYVILSLENQAISPNCKHYANLEGSCCPYLFYQYL